VVSNPFSFANNFLEDQLQRLLEWMSRKHFVWHPPIKIIAGPALWKNWFTWQKHPDGLQVKSIWQDLI
jgi:phosphatidylserine/phosphatidylglycerophosphate/cardiolipin synthase-like enzyme